MIFEFGNCKLDIDVEKTKTFYEKESMTVGEACDCDGCQNFDRAIEVLPLAVKEFFHDIGVDIRKACECSAYETNTDGTLLYIAYYHICGVIINGENSRNNPDKNEFEISDGFLAQFTKYAEFWESDFPYPIIELVFSANFPWVLDKENTYEKFSD